MRHNDVVVVIITGPIASGKSTLARAVARHLVALGRTAAVIDLDLVYEMLGHEASGRKDDEATWQVARRAAGALTDAFVSAGVTDVIVEGRLLTRPERATFLDASVEAAAKPRFVILRTSYAEALQRVKDDPTRTMSRDPAFLGPYYATFERDLAAVPADDLVIDTARMSVDEAAQLVAQLAGRHDDA